MIPANKISLPRNGPARAALQAKGQFWTPAWVAEAMAAFVLEAGPAVVFDPAVGAGAFLSACREQGYKGSFAGFEPDEMALAGAKSAGLSDQDLRYIQVQDFFTGRLANYSAVLSNPPYIRHHRIPIALKQRLQSDARKNLGLEIDGRAGLHVYFLIHCLRHLVPGGRLAFVLPADVCEGVYAPALWHWMTANYRLCAVVTFAPEAAPFPEVDTNAVIVAFENAPPDSDFCWTQLKTPDTQALRTALISDGETPRRSVAEAIKTGMSRPAQLSNVGAIFLGDVARVMRGIATGANDFFFLTSQQIDELGLRREWFVRALGRTRDCAGDSIKAEQLEHLDQAGRPTWLLNLPQALPQPVSPALRAYLDKGEQSGLPGRPLIGMRKTWYRMEQREVPPLLFAYLGRRACRFILNQAGVLPLTGYLCIYPRNELGLPTETLWRLLNDAQTLGQLAYVGKSYGGGAIKVEPRALERLVLPHSLCSRYGVSAPWAERQLTLMEPKAKYRIHKTVSARKVG